MIWLSELLLQNHQLESFEQLLDVLKDRARAGEMFFRADVKPPFGDTPEDWEDQMEAAFTGDVRE